MLLPILCILLFELLFCESYRQISCGDQFTGDTKATSDGLALFSFIINANITDIWWNLCGSTFDTWVSIYNNSQLLAYQDDSTECDLQSVLHISTTDYNVGQYVVNISGYAGDEGYYIIKMICNVYSKPIYKDLNECKHIYQYPIGICESSMIGYSNYTEWNSIKYGCDSYGVPQEYEYYGPHCLGNYTTFSQENSSSNCNALLNCSYATIQRMYSYDNICAVDDIKFNSSFWVSQEYNTIIDTCLPGNVKWFCSEEALIQKTYFDENCTHEFGDGEALKLGCNIQSDGFNIWVDSIQCHRFSYTSTISPIFPSTTIQTVETTTISIISSTNQEDVDINNTNNDAKDDESATNTDNVFG